MSNRERDESEQGDHQTLYSAIGSGVYHENEDCHHLEKANDIEEIKPNESDSLRKCYQCAYDALPAKEKRRRKRRSNRSRSVTVWYRR